MYQFHQQLAGLHRREHVHAQRLFLHLVGKFLGHLEIHIRVQQRTADVLHGLRHVYLGYLTFTLQYLERAFESVT